MKFKTIILSISLFGVATLSSCDNSAKVQAEAAVALEHGNYQGALKKILDLSDKQIEENDSLVLMLSEAYYGLTGKSVSINAQSLCDMDFTAAGDMVIFTDLKNRKIMKFSYPELSLLGSIETPGGVYAVDISPSGKDLAAALSTTEVAIYDIESGDLKKTLKGHTNQVRAVAFLDTTYLVTGGNDQYMITWDLNDNKMIDKEWPHRKNIKSLKKSLDSNYVVSGSNDGTAVVWNFSDVSKPKEVRKFKHGKNYVNDAMLSPDNRVLVTASGDGDLKIWNAKNFDLLHTIPLEDVGCSIDFSEDGNMILIGGYSGVHFIDAETGMEVYKYPLSNDPVWSVKFLGPDKFAFIDATHYYEEELLTKEALVEKARLWLKNQG